MLKSRRVQASKSILIQVDDRYSCRDLHEYLNSLGEVRIMYHYTTKDNSHFALVEMASQEAISDVLHQANKPGNLTIGSSKIPHFKSSRKRRKHQTEISDNLILDSPIYALQSSSILDTNDGTLASKMLKLHEQLCIDDLGFRLRFLTCIQVETLLKTIDPSIIVLPYGSSVNGFGSKGGDLDMVALPNYDYSTENVFDLTRDMEQSQIILAADLIKNKLPGSRKTFPIPRAKVPIVKYRHAHTSLDCDLSFYRRDSLIMSELLYFLATVDPRVKPLTFLIRAWAKKMTLTNDFPGRWISNFSLTLLVIFYLQRKHDKSASVLPPLRDFSLERNNLMPNEIYLELFNRYYELAGKNEDQLEDLLVKFFGFYSNFHYNDNGISLRSGKIVKKSIDYPLYIENPLYPDLNVSENVQWREVDRIREGLKSAFNSLKNQMGGYQFSTLKPVPERTRKSKSIK